MPGKLNVIIDECDEVVEMTVNDTSGAIAEITHQAELAEQYASEAEQSASTASGAASTAVSSAAAAKADAIQTAADRAQTELDRVATGEDALATKADAVKTAEDREQTGMDRIATGEDRAQTVLDAQTTAADRVQTGQDRIQTGEDRTQTTQDALATAGDREQTGIDRQAAVDAAGAAVQAASNTNDDRVAVNQARVDVEGLNTQAQTAATTATEQAGIATAKASEAGDYRDEAEGFRDDAQTAAASITPSVTPMPNTIPIARETSKIDGEWIDGAGISGVPLAGINGLSFALDALRAATLEARYGDGPYPSLDLQFAGATMVDPRIDFTRGSEATGWVNGQLKTFGIDEPRFVTDPSTGYSGLLLEPFTSTNLFLHSKGNVLRVSPPYATVIENGIGDPGGGNTGTLIVGRLAGSDRWEMVCPPNTFTTGQTVVASWWVLDPSGSFSGSTGMTFMSHENAQVDQRKVFEMELPNGWVRYSGVATITNGAEESRLRLYAGVNNSDETTELGVWGIQIETGTKATSYIPTGDSQVTRAGDFFTLPVGDWYRPDRGTLISTATTPIGETVATLGDIVIISDSDEMKTYTAPYSSPNEAEALVLGGGLFSSVRYFPQVLS